MNALRIGLLGESLQQLKGLDRMVVNAGHCVGATLVLEPEVALSLPDVDAWLVKLDLRDRYASILADRLDQLDVPVIFDDEALPPEDSPGYEDWSRRFNEKLRQCPKDLSLQGVVGERATEVWILAASAGGLESTLEFLHSVSGNFGHVAFLYVQHMDTGQYDNLLQVLGNRTQCQVESTTEPKPILANRLYVVSPKSQLNILQNGTLVPTADPWVGPYAPSIDQMVAKIARLYADKSGMIIFSGMAEDGRGSCEFMARLGGSIWAQLPESCAVDSMPQSVIDTGCVTCIATPDELGKHFLDSRINFEDSSSLRLI